jgi:serine/threonine-protein kinase
MVQEHLKGQSLRERLDKGALPLDKALDLAIEVGEALIAAHKAGIIHRDLKPDNIFVTEEGHAKVLDFGLAKLTEMAAPTGNSASMSPTMLGTVAGQVMGTAGYMAPEQAAGSSDIDHRADLFAIGCVLYEMVTGSQPFAGRSVAETLSKIQHESAPSLVEMDPSRPAELHRITNKSMAKEPERRYQGATDLVVDLRALLAEVESGRAVAALSGAASRHRAATGAGLSRGGLIAAAAIPGLIVGALLYALIGGGVFSDAAGTGAGSAAPLYLPLQAVPGLNAGNWSQMALSPEGRHLAFATGSGLIRLWDLAATVSERELPETNGATTPFFSADGEWLAYLGTDNRLFRVPVDGGRPQPLTDRVGHDVGAATWFESGEILFVANFSVPTMHIPAAGGAAEPLLELDSEAGEIGHGPASYLPDGDRLLYSYWDDRWRIGVHSLTTGERTTLTEGYGPRYTPTGHLVYILNEQLMAATFDPATLEMGEPVQLLNTLGSTPGWGRTAYDFSANGTLAYLESPADRTTAVLRIDTDGTRTVVRPGDRELVDVRISPSGDRLAVDVHTRDGDTQVWTYDMTRDDFTPVAQGDGWDQFGTFSPDGDRIAYYSERLSSGDIFVRAADGSGEETPLIVSPDNKSLTSWSPQGLFAAEIVSASTGHDIWLYSPDDPDNPVRFVESEAWEGEGFFSPDGDFLAFQSDRSGRNEIYVVPYPGGPAEYEWKVTTGGGIDARWTSDGRRLFYRVDGRIMVTPVVQTEPFRTGEPTLFTDIGVRGWDVAPDGSYIIAIEELAPPRPRLVLNWFEELKRLVPTGR